MILLLKIWPNQKLASSNGKLQDFINRLSDRARVYGTKVSTQKNKTMINSTNNITVVVNMNAQKLQEKTSFKYLKATLAKDGTCSAKIHIMVASAMAVMARLNRVW